MLACAELRVHSDGMEGRVSKRHCFAMTGKRKVLATNMLIGLRPCPTFRPWTRKICHLLIILFINCLPVLREG